MQAKDNPTFDPLTIGENQYQEGFSLRTLDKPDFFVLHYFTDSELDKLWSVPGEASYFNWYYCNT